MKTVSFNKNTLFRLAYGGEFEGFISPAKWISSHVDIIFKSDLSTSSYRFVVDGSDFDVYVCNYRQRRWLLLFTSTSARFLLQDLYDFLYAEPINN